MQTPVEWLVNELRKYDINEPISLASWEVLDELLIRAIAMEKEQIKEAYQDGCSNSYLENAGEEDECTCLYPIPEEYYNQTYNK